MVTYQKLNQIKKANIQRNVIFELFAQSVSKYPNKPALIYKDKNNKYTSISYINLNNLVIHFCYGLIKLGVNKNDTIALFSENRYEWAVADLSTLSIGVINVPIYSVVSDEYLVYVLNDCKTKIAIVSSEDKVNRLIKLKSYLPFLETIIVMDNISIKYCNNLRIYTFNEILEIGKDSDFNIINERLNRMDKVREDDVATIVYTSGTTGDPKGVMLTNKNISSNVLTLCKLVKLKLNDRELSFLPLAHTFERVVYYSILYQGATIVYAESIHKLSENLKEVNPEFLICVPRVLEKMHKRILENINSSNIKRKLFNWAYNIAKVYDNLIQDNKQVPVHISILYKILNATLFKIIRNKISKNLKLIICGGAHLRLELEEFFSLLGFNLCIGYGLTETSPVVTFNNPGNVKRGTVGRPIPEVQVKISSDGEILVKGPNVMKGYYNKPEETNKVFDEEGWFYTGDIGYLDQDSFLVITDRKKDIIVTSNGKNVSPQKIENILKNSKYIEEVIVIGDNKPFLSALIVPNLEELINYANQNNIIYLNFKDLLEDESIYNLLINEIKMLSKNLCYYEQIKKIAILNDKFAIENNELTPTLKCKRKVIYNKYKELIENLYK